MTATHDAKTFNLRYQVGTPVLVMTNRIRRGIKVVEGSVVQKPAFATSYGSVVVPVVGFREPINISKIEPF